jgi:hypothetical protein
MSRASGSTRVEAFWRFRRVQSDDLFSVLGSSRLPLELNKFKNIDSMLPSLCIL